MAVTVTTEAVGTPPTNANKAAGAPRLCAFVKSSGRACQNISRNPYKVTGAFAQAVTITTEAIGTWPTAAIKSARTPRLDGGVAWMV